MNRVCATSLLLALLLCDRAFAGVAADAPDYALQNHWLCKPGRIDACAIDVNATTISPRGASTVDAFVRPSAEKPIDCFYVYPTVSMQDADLSDLVQESAQFSRVRTQFARYANVCRLFAPMYRQVTLKTMAQHAVDLKTFDPNAELAAAPQYKTAYADILAAWKYYLAHDNHGRGVILIGHSQGAFLLRDLIKAEIEGRDAQKNLVSAHLAGVVIAVSKTDAARNEFKTLKSCTDGAQTNCFISFSTFAESDPPPTWSKAFGVSKVSGAVNNCSNPAALSGDSGRLLPYVDASRNIEASEAAIKWTKTGATVATPLVALPDFLKAECVSRDDGAGYLAIRFANASAQADVRERYLPGHVYVGPVLLSNWGLHDADMELTMGNLVKLAALQAVSWQKSHTTSAQ
ncbi:MAG: DUF3089 domain-containing protein [Rudaea sp.]|uniref:DUF3089 domain-containing protein n=1 Tax=Rudaea sp. 3F27F6 TaxID=2502208 RepID=UPI0010F48742|nr:DUF3089 domain-containing protein [Rudaea sp. 3F27F6]MBR0347726.1 DUF3089 domain-containing protein [Rudaea sp.]